LVHPAFFLTGTCFSLLCPGCSCFPLELDLFDVVLPSSGTFPCATPISTVTPGVTRPLFPTKPFSSSLSLAFFNPLNAWGGVLDSPGFSVPQILAYSKQGIGGVALRFCWCSVFLLWTVWLSDCPRHSEAPVFFSRFFNGKHASLAPPEFPLLKFLLLFHFFVRFF